jgi:hypothetical protein
MYGQHILFLLLKPQHDTQCDTDDDDDDERVDGVGLCL